ncbi:Grixazone synthase [Triangularia setosa]|uniref:Grixazone synthase n=1 Tax=Triangularia setosa TaxID=2587417 RepID=A0AAN6W9B0_9PEZI|nr:Grixazone synthase [Podospora setosa]
MKVSSFIAGVLPLASLVLAAPGLDPEKAADKKINHFEKKYQKYIEDTIKKHKTGCTKNNIRRRKEWSKLTRPERKAYLDAIYCISAKPGVTPQSVIPGARSRFDDFVVSHIQLTPFVHANGFFLAYHRYLIWLFETALREECGYNGAQPYWDWTLHWQDQSRHPVFDGSPWSLGTNGAYVPDRDPITIYLPGPIPVTFPPATGGGCVSGPLGKDKFKVNLGPIGYSPQGPDGGLGYNPRCLTRDLSPQLSQDSLRPRNVSFLLESDSYAAFNFNLDRAPGGNGVHGAGHFLIGTVQLDTYASPSDPMFYLHHSNLDRLFAIWQGQDQGARTGVVWGTQTSGNVPPSANVTLDTPVPFGYVSPDVPLGDLQSSIGGPFCFIYE